MRFIDSWRWRFFPPRDGHIFKATKELRNFVVIIAGDEVFVG